MFPADGCLLGRRDPADGCRLTTSDRCFPTSDSRQMIPADEGGKAVERRWKGGGKVVERWREGGGKVISTCMAVRRWREGGEKVVVKRWREGGGKVVKVRGPDSVRPAQALAPAPSRPARRAGRRRGRRPAPGRRRTSAARAATRCGGDPG
eukprot:gene15744-biopygen2842